LILAVWDPFPFHLAPVTFQNLAHLTPISLTSSITPTWQKPSSGQIPLPTCSTPASKQLTRWDSNTLPCLWIINDHKLQVGPHIFFFITHLPSLLPNDYSLPTGTILSTFFCKSKTVLKSKVYLKEKKNLTLVDIRAVLFL
jgi:hypothetical protein